MFNYLSSTYGLGYKVYEWLVFGHVVYRGFDIFISGDTPDGVFKKGHSMCSVIMEKSCRIRYIIYIWTMIQKEIL